MDKGKLIGQGRTAEIFALEDNRVLKLFRADMAHKSVEKEYNLGKVIAGSGVPAPLIYGMVTLEGRQGIVYEFVPGKTMLEYISSRPLAAKAEARQLARIHHGIHNHAVTGLPKQKSILAETIERVKVLSAPERLAVLQHLEALPQGDKLCHGDFHPDNVMVTPQKTFVLDWMNASLGSPEADVARTTLLLRDAAPPPGAAEWIVGLLHILRKQFFTAYIQEYYRIAEVSPDKIEAWILPVAAARLTEDLPQAEKQVLQKIVRARLKE